MHATEKNQRIHKQSTANEEKSVLVKLNQKRPSISPVHQQLLSWKGQGGKRGSEQSLSKGNKKKNSHGVAVTDESSNNRPSIFQESIELIEKERLNEQYFQAASNALPLFFKQKRTKLGLKKSQEARKIGELSIKLSQISDMVVSQEMEIRRLKSSVSEKELHRLLKMHSIEKLQLLSKSTLSKKGKHAG